MTTGTSIAVVRCTMLAGAIYDALFAVPILVAPAWLSGLIAVSVPQEEIYLRFIGVFLLGLALFYLLPVIHAGRYLGNVAAAVAVRTAGGAFMLVAVLGFAQPRPFILLAAGDLFFAVLHYLSLVPLSGWKIWRLAGAEIASSRPNGGRL